MLEIKNKIKFENKQLWVSEIDATCSNSNEEERIRFVTDIASISKGKLGFKEIPQEVEGVVINPRNITIKVNNEMNRKKLYQKLLTESDDMPSTPFEFVPVKVKTLIGFNKAWIIDSSYKFSFSITDYINKIAKYSFLIEDRVEGYYLLTNMRTLLKAGIPYKDIPYNTPDEINGFKVILGKLPKVAFDHLVTHRQLGRIAESSRNKKYLNEVEFWYPTNWNIITKHRFTYKTYKQTDDNQIIEDLMKDIDESIIRPENATKELSCRRLMLCAFKGWIQDKNIWDNLFAVRGKDTGTQSITFKVVENIKKLIK